MTYDPSHGMAPDPYTMWRSGPAVPAMGACDICGASVFMTDAERHTAWHEDQGVKASELAAALLANEESPSPPSLFDKVAARLDAWRVAENEEAALHVVHPKAQVLAWMRTSN